jgi:hypothetical protein
MLALALPLHRTLFPGHADHEDLAGPERENQVISEVLDHIADSHSTRTSYIDDAKADLDEARQFVAQKHLVTLPQRSNLQVIPTPEFMRGIYSVGGFNPAPPLEPALGAFYWITPIPADWDRPRADSKLREYNFYKLKLLTLHEAIPGHYVQFEYANDIQPATRRLLRALYGNTPYIEGWAQYATEAVLDAGFLDNSPELRLTFAKEELRVIANAILDIRLQMLNMTDQEALELMERQTFQEPEEATAKLQRAKLSSAQLPAYFVGWRGWLAARDKYQKSKGGQFNPAEFHDAALQQGAVPLPELLPLLHGTFITRDTSGNSRGIIRAIEGHRFRSNPRLTIRPTPPRERLQPDILDPRLGVVRAHRGRPHRLHLSAGEGGGHQHDARPAKTRSASLLTNSPTAFGIGAIERGDMVVFWFPLETFQSPTSSASSGCRVMWWKSIAES